MHFMPVPVELNPESVSITDKVPETMGLANELSNLLLVKEAGGLKEWQHYVADYRHD
jgi:hypothetical protein